MFQGWQGEWFPLVSALMFVVFVGMVVSMTVSGWVVRRNRARRCREAYLAGREGRPLSGGGR